MALVTCADCKKDMSTSADACPHCGNKAFWEYNVERKEQKCEACRGAGYADLSSPNENSIWVECRGCSGAGCQFLYAHRDIRNGTLTWTEGRRP